MPTSWEEGTILVDDGDGEGCSRRMWTYDGKWRVIELLPDSNGARDSFTVHFGMRGPNFATRGYFWVKNVWGTATLEQAQEHVERQYYAD